MRTLAEIRAAVGGDICGSQVCAPGPGHSPRDRSLAVKPSPTWDGFIVYAHSPANTWQQCKGYVRERLGIQRGSPRPPPNRALESRRAGDAADLTRRIMWARRLWDQAVDPRGTIVERYLAGRGLNLPAEIAGTVLRFNARCLWRNEEGVTQRRPVMLAAMRDVLSGEIRAVHRTLLTDDARKLDRRMLGPAAGCAIMFNPAGSSLVAGEGIESALSARQLGYGLTWALGSAGEIERLRIIPGVVTLTLLEERDKASARAVRICADRWGSVGREVRAVLPPSGKDMNDYLREIGR